MPHYELLLAVLDARQMAEIEAYAGLEPIGGMVGVSRPPEEGARAPQSPEEGRQIFETIAIKLGASPEKKRKRKKRR